ncbi:MAG TPA: bifunctional DNA-binding transcriptional regulator/O6-methylguanine-DNA methyltransferase Ada [Vicinamibacteria bacterium]|nr:bifunctional DNA-binding transcriptional regulator/O6-methylguanine-DNA methyltransferase Ada [Vicinamibacteria bacterium]
MRVIAIAERDRRWRAVARRDRSADGRFVFAVSTTGIYCRPSCPARRPRRERVAFYDNCEAAEAAGFRACRRCRPRLGDPRASLVTRVRRLIDASPEAPPSLASLGEATGLSPWHLQRTFREATGFSPRQYAAAQRLEALKRRLKEGDAVTEAIYEAGYGSSTRAYAETRGRLGMTPAVYRKGGRGLRLGYTVVETPLGRMLVAASDRGVSAVQFGRSERELVAGLRREYPAADIVRDRGSRAEWVQAVVARVKGGTSVEIPVDIQATAFQWRVFEALREIPQGETRSYGEIARAIGEPGAARAVGRACATNPVAVVIPCHRAVGASGKPTGYRWGIPRKEKLLANEARR